MLLIEKPSLEKGRKAIQEFGNKKEIKPKYIHKAVKHFEKLIQTGLNLKGSRVEDTALAVLYLTCKENHSSLLPGDLPRKDNVLKRYKKIKREHDITTPIPQPEDYINRLACNLEAGSTSIFIVEKIIKNLPPNNLRPQIITGASFYIAMKTTGEGVSYYKIQELIDTTQPTLRRAVNKILELTGIKKTWGG